jgi:hypothetical protein
MIWELWWKEYREQRGLWLVMVGMTALLLAGMIAVLSPGGREALPSTALLMAVTYGLVCGSMMLAGERETRTLTFLDTHAGRRATVWKAKALAGAVFTLVLSLVLSCLALPFYREPLYSSYLLLTPLLAVDAYAWGLLASALAHRGFVAALLGAVFLTLSWLATGVVIWAAGAGGLAFRLGLALVAALLSYRAFCEPDRRRLPAAAGARSRVASGWAPRRRVLLWLVWRQGRVEAGIVLAVALLLGMVLPLVGAQLAFSAVLLAGVVCGVAVFADEQEGGAYRFLGDQRLALGRVWAVKTLCWFVAAVATAGAVFLGTGLSVAARLPGHDEAKHALWPLGPMTEVALGNEMVQVVLRLAAILLMLLVYGFTAGQLAGLFARRRLPALAAAGATAVALASLWIPSLLLGGLPLWQLLGPPVLLLAAGRLVMWWWASDRLLTLRPVAYALGCALLIVLWMAGSLWYRVAAVPDVGPPFDQKAFAETLSRAAKSEAGPLIREASKELSAHQQRVNEELRPPNQGGGAPQGPGQGEVPAMGEGPPMPEEPAMPVTYQDRLGEAIDKGWPKDAQDLDRWLDRMFAGKWVADFRKAAALPPGLVTDPRNVSLSTNLGYLQGSRESATLFTGRAVQLQARGDPAAGLDQVAVSLGLSRQMRHLSPLISRLVGNAMEQTTLAGLERWLTDLGPRAPLLRRALDVLKQHEDQLTPLSDNVKAEYLIVRNSLNDTFSPAGNLTSKLYAYARMVPWEAERERRLLNGYFAREIQWVSQPPWQLANIQTPPEGYLDGRPLRDWSPVVGLLVPAFRRIALGEPAALSRVRAARLQVALALYQAENGKPAARLEDLVPRYLDRPLVDPYSGQPFHYRVSAGERIENWSEEPAGVWRPRDVPAGQGVLWSVGPDGKDDGGHRQGGASQAGPGAGEAHGPDMIFLVPRWPKR